jgi:uncharacterized protein
MKNLRTGLLTAECLLLCVVMPLLFVWVIPLRGLFAALWLCAAYGVWRLRRVENISLKDIWNRAAVTRAALLPIMGRFVIATILITLVVAYWMPEKFLAFPRDRTMLWALVMVFYPLLSVIPQEMIFRPFFFRRYQALFPHPKVMLIVNALAFGFAHVVFQNWVSVVLCSAGGAMFALTYQRSRSLALVCIEHALYGCMIFTVGLGYYFYHGAVVATH